MAVNPLKNETVTFRISPRTRFNLELLCRQRHQSLSGVFESALDAMAHPDLDRLWHPYPAVRALRMKHNQPSCAYLLNIDEDRALAKLPKHFGDDRMHQVTAAAMDDQPSAEGASILEELEKVWGDIVNGA
jgi:hypothetical protein